MQAFTQHIFPLISTLLLQSRDDDDGSGPLPQCQADSDYKDIHMGARISSVFVILITSMFGAFFPLMSSTYSFLKLPEWCFFLAKYFGSGVIIATAFIHLLQPANESLSDDCLGGVYAEYPMAFGICLIFVFVMFFSELLAQRRIDARKATLAASVGVGLAPNGPVGGEHVHVHSMFGEDDVFVDRAKKNNGVKTNELTQSSSNNDSVNREFDQESLNDKKTAKFLGDLFSVFVLEFGILFHSVFIGLSLACAGDEFITLYIVLVFHQTFEGLGLGTRIALVDWPKSKKWTPWLLCLGYGLTTPLAIAIGLGVRESYLPGSRTSLIVNGVFDSISAGILIYTGMIELMANEFLYNDEFKGDAGFVKMLWAFGVMTLGAGIMALLGKWA
ncbi:unnamed protein product [Ambrosiozyma monospora]|uniref:Unnamed protein product n=1 Tax=Ambrosiozyma monospora TaxID=43982 RepID=A0ACB5T1W9_AMBMO|nr:unnamed protein product [Ambrosiozyma monospora]